MKIRFCLGWASGNMSKAFKSQDTGSLFKEYTGRIGKFDACTVTQLDSEKKPGTKLWLCHTAKNAKMFSSEELAKAVGNIRDSAAQELCIGIGPSDGFTAKDVENLKPDVLWSFGPMTLPHELAAVIAAEQIYRAYTIIYRLPYHSSH